jgi:hypothetical protein
MELPSENDVRLCAPSTIMSSYILDTLKRGDRNRSFSDNDVGRNEVLWINKIAGSPRRRPPTQVAWEHALSTLSRFRPCFDEAQGRYSVSGGG